MSRLATFALPALPAFCVVGISVAAELMDRGLLRGFIFGALVGLTYAAGAWDPAR
jgi:hypothetical protein